MSGKHRMLAFAMVLALGTGCASDDDDESGSPSPSIVRIVPNLGPLSGGTRVVLTCRNFGTPFTSSTPTVEFNGQPGTGLSVLDDDRVEVSTPPSAQAMAVGVAVRSGDGTQTAAVSGGFTYTDGPIVTAVIPYVGTLLGGESVTVEGHNFDTVGTVIVTIGGTDATGVVVLDTSTITCLIPAGISAGRTSAVVTNPGGAQGTLPGGFTYVGNDPAVLAMEDQVLTLVNAERALVAKPPLVVDPLLRLVARAHSEDMRFRAYFDHFDPDGDGPGDRLGRAGFPFTAWAENVAWNSGYPDPGQTAVGQWLGSPPHKRAMLDEGNVGYTLTGIGCATNGSGKWWFTQIFVRQ